MCSTNPATSWDDDHAATARQSGAAGMTANQAKAVEYAIIFVSVLSLVLLFQPFSLELYSVGAGLVVLAGLAFNLVPLCTPGRPLRSLLKGALDHRRHIHCCYVARARLRASLLLVSDCADEAVGGASAGSSFFVE